VKLKILFVQKEGGIFGAENYQLKVIPGLLAQGIDLEFLRLYTDYQGGAGGDFVDLLTRMGVKVHEVNIGKYPLPGVLRRIHKLAKSGNYDLVHTHLIHADFHLVLAKMLFRGKYKLVSTKHGYDNNFTSRFGFDASKQTKTPYFLISRFAERRMIASYTISHGLRNFFIKTGLTSKDRMSLIHYGFDMPENHEFKNQEQHRFASKQIFIAGRLVAFKGHKYLLDAMPRIVEALGDEVKLVIAGTGDEEETLKQQVSDLGIEKYVIFLGYSKEVGPLMANSDVVTIPSISEGFGVVFLEAFSAKTPVVSWDVPAGNELMKNKKDGYLVQPYNTAELSDCLISVLQNPANQKPVVEAAYEKLKSYFRLNRMVDQTIQFYHNSLNL